MLFRVCFYEFYLPVEGEFKGRLKNMTANLIFFDSLCR